MTEFLHMGGYAAFVWGAYGVAALALIWLALASLGGQRRARRQVDRQRAARRQGAPTARPDTTAETGTATNTPATDLSRTEGVL